MHVDTPCMGVISEPVQSAQSLRERAHAALFRDEVLRVDVRSHLEGLRRDHHKVPPADGLYGAARGHAATLIQDARPYHVPPPVPVRARSATALQPRHQASGREEA